MKQPVEPYRRMLLHLVRLGGLAAVSLVVLTACYTDVAIEGTATAISLAVATVPQPTNPPAKTPEQPTDGGGGATEPDGGGGDQSQPPDGGGGGDGGEASPEAADGEEPTIQVLRLASPIASPSRTIASPISGIGRTPGASPVGLRTPTPRTGTTPIRTAQGGPVGTVRTTPGTVTRPTNVTPVSGGTVSSVVTPLSGGTVPVTTGSPSTESMGAVLVAKVDAAGTPIGGACFDVVAGDRTVGHACDNGEGDGDDRLGMIRIDAPSGDHILRETPPSGYQPTQAAVSIAAGAETAVSIVNQPETGDASPSVPAGDGVVIVLIVGADGTTAPAGVCVQLTGPGNYQACDDQGSDADPLPGTIEIDQVLAGDYALTAIAPDGYELVEPPAPVRVVSADLTQVTLSFRAASTVTTQTETPTESPTETPTTVTSTETPTETPSATPSETPTEEATPPQVGVLVARIYLEDGTTALGNACLDLTGPTTLGVCDDQEPDADQTPGTIELASLPIGDYTIAVRAPEGYEPAGEQQSGITIAPDGVFEVAFTFRLIPTTGTVRINKVDAADGTTPLGGACFELTAEAGQYPVCDNEEGDADGTAGVILIQNVVAGDYTLRETRAPDGRVAGPDLTVPVAVGQEVPVIVPNGTPEPAPLGTVQVAIVDQQGNALSGACLSLVPLFGDGDPAPRDVCDGAETEGPADGAIAFADLPSGSYEVRETSAPTGYAIADPMPAEIPAEGGAVAVQLIHQLLPGTLVITKVDAIDGTSLLPGACFAVIDANGNRNDACDVDNVGTVRFEGLPAGDYTVQETQPPQNYLAADDQSVTVPAGGEASLTFFDHAAPTTGSLTVVTLNQDGAGLTGACYVANGPNEGYVEGCDDDNDAVVPLGEVAAGEWLVRQSTPPAGYDPSDPVEQPVTVIAGQPAQVEFRNQPSPPQTGSIAITVQDDQGQPVGGACFDLAGPEAIRTCDDVERDDDPTPGRLLVPNVPPGDYAVSQSQTPEGYRQSEPATVNVVAGGDPAPLALVNAKEPAGVPLPAPVVFSDDAGRLWLLRPNDTQPAQLDTPDLRYDPAQEPVFTSDRSWVAFLVSNPSTPAANMQWVRIADLSFGPLVDFSSVGQPRQIAWLPGSTDTLMVAVDLPGGGGNVVFFRTDTSEVPVTLFAGDQLPARIERIVPAPTGGLVAIQATGADGTPDTYVVNTADPASLKNVGTNEGNDPAVFLAWSPAGDRLLLRSGPDASQPFVTDAGGVGVALGATPIFDGDPATGTAPQWSADTGVIAYFDGDPAAGGQLYLVGSGGNAICGPIPSIIAADWSPAETLLWVLLPGAEGQTQVGAIGGDCAPQTIATVDGAADKLVWAPNGGALAIVDRFEGGASLSLIADGQIMSVDQVAANVGLADTLTWSPGGEALPLLASSTRPALWVVNPGSPVPAPANGSALPEGSAYVTRVWWA